LNAVLNLLLITAVAASPALDTVLTATAGPINCPTVSVAAPSKAESLSS
jgi:predicted S18 family serine protease